jgi:threonyl-tRNA synthetase
MVGILQRIYGTAWENKEQLEVFNFRQAEAKRRDHRTLGKQLNLFSIQEDAGGGLVFWHAKGALIRRLIEDYWKSQHLQVRLTLPIHISSVYSPLLAYLEWI